MGRLYNQITEFPDYEKSHKSRRALWLCVWGQSIKWHWAVTPVNTPPPAIDQMIGRLTAPPQKHRRDFDCLD